MEKNNKISNCFKSILSYLRSDNPELIGENGVKELIDLVILKIINLSSLINIEIKDVNLSNLKMINKEEIDISIYYTNYNNLLNYTKIYCNLYNKYGDDINNEDKEEEIKEIFNNNNLKITNILNPIELYNNILQILNSHKQLSNIYCNNTTNIKNYNNLYKILKTINKNILLENLDYDILGDLYERTYQNELFCSDKKIKKAWGQFFTPLIMDILLIELVKPKLKYDENNNIYIETLFEPAIGSGGIILSYIKYYFNNYPELKNKLISLFNISIYGCEIKSNVLKLALCNLLFHTGKILNNIKLGNSISNLDKDNNEILNQEIKFDISCSNPPFSMLINPEIYYNNGLCPIILKGKSSHWLFLELIINKLKINGRGAVVLQNDKLTCTNKSNLNIIRECLLKTCKILKIIICPSGSFTSTTTETIIINFIKQKEINDVLTVIKNKNYNKYKYDFKTDKIINDKIEFYNLNDINKPIRIINKNQIIENDYSLYYYTYNNNENNIIDNLKYKEIKDILEYIKVKKDYKHNAKYGQNEGKYNFYSSSKNNNNILKCDKYDFEDEYLIIGTGGEANIKFDKQFSISSDNILYQSKDDKILLKYVYYYLYFNINLLQQYFYGVSIKHLDKNKFKTIKIPIITLDLQQKIINILDNINNKKIINNNIFNLLLLNQIDKFNNIIKTKINLININNNLNNLINEINIDNYNYINLLCDNINNNLNLLKK